MWAVVLAVLRVYQPGMILLHIRAENILTNTSHVFWDLRHLKNGLEMSP